MHELPDHDRHHLQIAVPTKVFHRTQFERQTRTHRAEKHPFLTQGPLEAEALERGDHQQEEGRIAVHAHGTVDEERLLTGADVGGYAEV